MKKTLAVFLVAVILCASVFALTACVKDNTLEISKIELTVVAGNRFVNGTTFDKSKITVNALLNDETKKEIASSNKGLTYDTSALKLDASGKFTTVGKFTLKVKYLEEFEASVEIDVRPALND